MLFAAEVAFVAVEHVVHDFTSGVATNHAGGYPADNSSHAGTTVTVVRSISAVHRGRVSVAAVGRTVRRVAAGYGGGLDVVLSRSGHAVAQPALDLGSPVGAGVGGVEGEVGVVAAVEQAT